jgi:hypothetical protein
MMQRKRVQLRPRLPYPGEDLTPQEAWKMAVFAAGIEEIETILDAQMLRQDN